MTSIKSSPRVGAYVDGYNLYYGRLRGTPHKWLDVVRLLDDLLARRAQNESLVKLSLFTAYALARFSTHGAASVEAQMSYLRALSESHGNRFEAVLGTHNCAASGSLMPEFVAGQPYDRKRRVRVWRVEEKMTDVNLAISMYRDAARGLYDRIVVVSNDSDLQPALRAIRADFPMIQIGIVMPIRPTRAAEGPHRRPSSALREHAHWTLAQLADDWLIQAQLPVLVPTRKKPIRKPAHW